MLKVAREKDHYRVELFQVNRLNTLFTELVNRQLTELLEVQGTRVLFNLDGVKFIDSEGFQVLVKATETAKKCGSEFLICNINEEIRELIDLLELESNFNFCTIENSREKILPVLD